MEFDFSQVPEDASKIQDGGGDRPSPGRGMVMITAWNEYGGATGQAHELEFEIVAWTEPTSVGMTWRENIFHKDNTGRGFPMRRMTCLAMAAGLFNANDVKQWKSQGSVPTIEMQKIASRPIMIELVEQPNVKEPTKRPYLNVGNIGLGMYHVKDPRVKAWPMNQSVFNRCAATVGDWVTEAAAAPAMKPVAADGTSNPFAAVT